jgi:hypothetical protein
VGLIQENILIEHSAVIPMNDPNGDMFPHLEAITPLLKGIFSKVFVSVPLRTQHALPEYMGWLRTNDFFQGIYHKKDVGMGEDFLELYAHAASASDPAQILHLCFIDRVAFALRSEHRTAFVADIQALKLNQIPLIFQRSELAWQTHPSNYREIEQMVTKAGIWLFGQALDFAWCHIVIQAQQLRNVVASIKRRDMSFFAEMVLAIKDEVATKEVDWLAWEDPFITGRNAKELKTAREQSIKETQKRLAHAIPMLQLLEATARASM